MDYFADMQIEIGVGSMPLNLVIFHILYLLFLFARKNVGRLRRKPHFSSLNMCVCVCLCESPLCYIFAEIFFAIPFSMTKI